MIPLHRRIYERLEDARAEFAEHHALYPSWTPVTGAWRSPAKEVTLKDELICILTTQELRVYAQPGGLLAMPTDRFIVSLEARGFDKTRTISVVDSDGPVDEVLAQLYREEWQTKLEVYLTMAIL